MIRYLQIILHSIFIVRDIRLVVIMVLWPIISDDAKLDMMQILDKDERRGKESP